MTWKKASFVGDLAHHDLSLEDGEVHSFTIGEDVEFVAQGVEFQKGQFFFGQREATAETGIDRDENGCRILGYGCRL